MRRPPMMRPQKHLSRVRTAVTILMWALLGGRAMAGPIFVTGAGPGGGPHVQVFDAATGNLIIGFFAYDPSFTGGVRVAATDINADGVPDVITAPGPGGGPHVRVFDGAALQTGQVVELFGLFAYAPSFVGGVYIGAGTNIPRNVLIDRPFHVFAVCPAATRFAVVSAAGALVRGSAGTTASRLTNGTYVVTFNIDVTDCAWQVTVGQTGSVGATTGVGNVAGRAGNANALFITTRDLSS
jgi:hypothetical protein